MNQQPRREICPQCKGSGKTFHNSSIYDWGLKICGACKGTGMIEINPPPKQLRFH